MNQESTNKTVQHNQNQNAFVIEKDDKQCLLEYSLNGSDIDFTHTYVPFALRGQGFAEQLVAAGLEWAKSNNYNIAASCWYVAKFLD